ncbi:UPF0175 family protein [Dyadobacter crusticola]|uniref:UPF0175 family protein n=1 Tax=Dyadobacter crusticola TaxID=292407 RepID=UPI0004E0FD03|nr:UPF0175 family protein [Dyadobacter crusticola]
MHTVIIEIPDELSSQEVSLSIARQLYEKELVSAEQAAKLAGIEEKDFMSSEFPKDRAESWSKIKYRTAEKALQEQVKKQGYTGLNKEEMDRLRDELDIQEPLELLFSQLTR